MKFRNTVSVKARAAALVTALFVLLSSLPVSPCLSASAATAVYEIHSTEDFEKLAAACVLDSYSKGLVVELCGDITILPECCIPIFCGTFNGEGHTISGVSITHGGSDTGLFRILEKSGRIRDLNVRGSIEPRSSGSYVGGIVGKNNGLIEDCTFTGNISGTSCVGGIAGTSAEGGRISGCSFAGEVKAERSVGGIVGKNYGAVSGCKNAGGVNVEEVRVTSPGLDELEVDIDVSSFLEGLLNGNDSTESEELPVSGTQDIGGIAGYSKGEISGCVNTGNVGYPHTGYNVGGIAGRQSGRITECQNSGSILGRKDVGGVVGQAEPNVMLTFSESTLKKLEEEFGNLRKKADDLADTAADSAGRLSENAAELSRRAEITRLSANGMLDAVTDFAKDNIDGANTEAERLKSTVSDLGEVFGSLSEAGSRVGDAVDGLCTALSGLSLEKPQLSEASDLLSEALDGFASAFDVLSEVGYNASEGFDKLSDSVDITSKKSIRRAFGNISDTLRELSDTSEELNDAADSLKKLIKNTDFSETDLESLLPGIKNILTRAVELAKDVSDCMRSLGSVGKSFANIIDNVEVDSDSISGSLMSFRNAMLKVRDASDALSAAVREADEALDIAEEELDGFYDSTEDTLGAFRDDVRRALEQLEEGIDELSGAIADVGDVIDRFCDGETFSLVPMGDSFNVYSDDFFDSLSQLSATAEKIRLDADGDTETFRSSTHSLIESFDEICSLIIGELRDLESDSEEFSADDYFLDVSDSALSGTTDGRLYLCENTGRIEADRNTGGIVGSMSVEYALDPEDDLQRPGNLNFTYRTKAVVRECRNSGRIVCKKDCGGGIIGNMTIGTVYMCESSGSVESTDGGYVGGIAGQSRASLRKCSASGSITGTRYVGGIAGSGKLLSECTSAVTLQGGEYVGSVAGFAEELSSVTKCGYLDAGIGGIDGISYAGIAEPFNHGTLLTRSYSESLFSEFNILFAVKDEDEEEEEILYTLPIRYGDELSGIVLPPFPEKEGCYGQWSALPDGTAEGDVKIYAEYTPYASSVSSAKDAESGKSLAVAEGKFTRDASLSALPSGRPSAFPEEDYWFSRTYDVTLNEAAALGCSGEMRFLFDEFPKTDVYVDCGNGFEKTEAEKRGSYLRFSVPEKTERFTVCFALAKPDKKVQTAAAAAGGVLLLSLLALLTVKAVKKRKSRKKRKKKTDADA